MARRFRWLSILFVLALAVSLLLGGIIPVTAQGKNGDLLLQQGVAEYQQGKYQAAIAFWQRALNSYQATPDNANQVIVLENLARVHQQIGQPEQAIAFWSQLTDRYQQQGNAQQLGRSLTELAQAYSSLGQHRQAIALLCGGISGDNQKSCNAASGRWQTARSDCFRLFPGQSGDCYSTAGYSSTGAEFD